MVTIYNIAGKPKCRYISENRSYATSKEILPGNIALFHEQHKHKKKHNITIKNVTTKYHAGSLRLVGHFYDMFKSCEQFTLLASTQRSR